MAELGYFEIGGKNNCILSETILKFMNLIFGKKLILKHFMHRTIPKWCVLGVFWTAQYISNVYFTWWRLLLTLLISFMGITPLGVFIFYSHSKTKKFRSQLLYFGGTFLNGISLDFCKKPKNIHFDLNLFFHLPTELVLQTYGPFSWSASQLSNIITSNSYISWILVNFSTGTKCLGILYIQTTSFLERLGSVSA